MPTCNLCGSAEFTPFRGRSDERCARCGSFKRHRIAFALYQRYGMLSGRQSPPSGTRVLHFAPEPVLHRKLAAALGAGYLTSDAVPEAYPHAQCLKLLLPEGMDIFPDEYFDFVIHNHVMEHIPGSFRDHFPAMFRVLKVGGKLIFSVPGPTMDQVTVEGGEHLTASERRAKFGQIDHLRRFGKDLPEFLAAAPHGRFSFDDLPTEQRVAIGAGPVGNRFLIWEKSESFRGKRASLPEQYSTGVGEALHRALKARPRIPKKRRLLRQAARREPQE